MGKVVWYLVDICRHDTIYHNLWLGTSCCTWFCSMDGIYLPRDCLWSLRNYFKPRTRQLHKDTYSKQQKCLLWGQDILPSLQSGTLGWCLTRFPHLFLTQKETPFPLPSFPLKKNRIFSFNHQSSIINQLWKMNGWNPTKNHPFYTGKSSSKPPGGGRNLDWSTEHLGYGGMHRQPGRQCWQGGVSWGLVRVGPKWCLVPVP